MRDRKDTHTGNARQVDLPVDLLSAGRVGGTEICVYRSVFKDKVLFLFVYAPVCVMRGILFFALKLMTTLTIPNSRPARFGHPRYCNCLGWRLNTHLNPN